MNGERILSQKNKFIIITGPESTGKTSIAKTLAEKHNGIYVPEFARDYICSLEKPYTYKDIEHIARKQLEQFDIITQQNNSSIIFFDTYLIITKIWMLWNSGKYEKWIDQAIKKTQIGFYLLCSADIEWVNDDVRENGGEARDVLFNLYLDELKKFNLNFKIIQGYGNDRIKNSINALNLYLK